MMSYGSRRSKAMFHCLMVARSSPEPAPGKASKSLFGDRMKTFTGNLTTPELTSGIGTGGMPLASVVTQPNCSAVLLKVMSYGNDPRSGRDQGSGLTVWP